MGRHTFEQVLTFGEWIYGDTHVTVLSSAMGAEAVPAHLARTPGPLNGDVRLQHIRTRSFPFGLVQVKYKTLE